MDPNATLERLLRLLNDRESASSTWENDAVRAYADLRNWIHSGGFKPKRFEEDEQLFEAFSRSYYIFQMHVSVHETLP